MITVGMHEAKSQLSKLGEKVHQGEAVVISKSGKPYLDLVLHKKSRVKRKAGHYKGQIEIAEDFDATPDDIISAFEYN